MSKHTPGPWTERLSQFAWSKKEDSDNWYVEAAGGLVTAGGLTKADARLISAAPDLLAALKAIVKDQENTGVSLGSLSQAARAAIAKAEGVS